jgi:hypothetical protein
MGEPGKGGDVKRVCGKEVKELQLQGVRKITGFVEDGVAKVHVHLGGERAEVLKVIRLLPDLARIFGISQHDPIAEKRKSPLGKSEL